MTGLLLTMISASPPAHHPEPESHRSGRCETLHSVVRMIESVPGWHVVSRCEPGPRGNWSIVVWEDGARGPGVIDPEEVSVISQCRPAGAIILNTRRIRTGAGRPYTVEQVSDSGFPMAVRDGLDFKARVAGDMDDPDVLRGIAVLLDLPVRELRIAESGLIQGGH